MLILISDEIGVPVHFQRYRSLFEMAMNARHPKVLKVKPPRGICSLQEAFPFGGDTSFAVFVSGVSGNGSPTRH